MEPKIYRKRDGVLGVSVAAFDIRWRNWIVAQIRPYDLIASHLLSLTSDAGASNHLRMTF